MGIRVLATRRVEIIVSVTKRVGETVLAINGVIRGEIGTVLAIEIVSVVTGADLGNRLMERIMIMAVDFEDLSVVEEEVGAERGVVLEVVAVAEAVTLGGAEAIEGVNLAEVLIRETVLADSRMLRPKTRRSHLMINRRL